MSIKRINTMFNKLALRDISNPNGIIILGYKYLNNNVLIRVALK